MSDRGVALRRQGWRSLLCLLAEHDILVRILETLVETFNLKGDFFVDEIKVGSPSVSEVPKEAILLLYYS